MNIIIPSMNSQELRAIKGALTDYNNINNVKIYISQSLVLDEEPIIMTLVNQEIDVVRDPSLRKNYYVSLIYCCVHNSYRVYKLETKSYIPDAIYSCELAIDEGTLQFSMRIENDDYQDEHDNWLVEGKKLVPNTALNLVEQDSYSECITFKIRKTYDGVSLLGKDRLLYVDFIPPNFEASEEHLKGATFLTDKITNISVIDENFVRLSWIVPRRAVQDAGTLKIALSIITPPLIENEQIKRHLYVWQTEPVSVQVHPNIGKRRSAGSIEDEEFNSVEALLDYVKNMDYVSEIDTENNTFTLITREDGVETKKEINMTDLAEDIEGGSGLAEGAILSGGGAADM